MLKVMTIWFAISPHFPGLGQTCFNQPCQTLADLDNPSGFDGPVEGRPPFLDLLRFGLIFTSDHDNGMTTRE